MIWLTWRLQRLEFLLLGLILVGLGALLLQSHADVVATSRIYTADSCPVPLVGPEQGCVVPLGRVYLLVIQALPFLALFPLVTALLLVLPIAIEVDKGTHRLAWTQSVTRQRWLGVRLGLVTLGGLAVALVFTTMFSWWSAPREALYSRLDQGWYDLRGVLPIGHMLFALGLMVAAGVVLRRPVPVIVLASLAFVTVRIPFALWVRPHLVAPVTSSTNWPSNGGWWLSSHWQKATGLLLSDDQLALLCYPPGTDVTRAAQSACMTEHGITRVQVFHPDSHYWPLQLIETGLFIAGGVALLGFSAWYVLTRIE